jgi:hypothetical protein
MSRVLQQVVASSNSWYVDTGKPSMRIAESEARAAGFYCPDSATA